MLGQAEHLDLHLRGGGSGAPETEVGGPLGSGVAVFANYWERRFG